MIGRPGSGPIEAGRWVLAAWAGVVAVGAPVAAYRLPVQDRTVWQESLVVAVSTIVLITVTWWRTGRAGTVDRPVVLGWGLTSGTVLGVLWIAEIAFNNLTPHTVSTAAARGVLDNVTWAIVGAGTLAAAALVTVRTRRWRSGLRAGAWSGVASGLGAGAGGAVLLALFRSAVEDDPLMAGEWQRQGAGLDLATYVTRETMAGVGGHVWVLGILQGVLLGLLAATASALVMRVSTAVRRTR